jgi:hypothetical protein
MVEYEGTAQTDLGREEADRSEVATAMVLLRERVDYLEGAISGLEKKLSPVMTPDSNEARAGVAPELIVEKSPLTEEIDNVRGRLETLTQHVEWMRGRVAL